MVLPRESATLSSGLVSFLGIKVNISIAYIKKKKYTKYDI